MKYLVKYKLKKNHSMLIDADDKSDAETKAHYYMSRAWFSQYHKSMVDNIEIIEIPNLYDLNKEIA